MEQQVRSGWAPDRGPGRIGTFWIAVWTFFLVEPLSAAWDRRDTVAGWAGIVLTIAFGVWYVAFFGYQRRNGFARKTFHLQAPKAAAGIALALVLAVADCIAIGQDGTATAVYLCVLFVMALPTPLSVVLALVNAAAWYAAGSVVPGWNLDNSLLLSMLTASAAVFGIQQMILGNIRLRRANEENQQLAVADERNRFSRDLHDILGHSLTVITVKAELANKLLDVDPERARAEVADLERLSRDALADVRRAVEGYRELTLPGELTRARTALRAAEIDADLPNSTDEVPGDLRELFAWTIREGVTNVIRHSGARTCTVRLTPRSAEVVDDGCGPVRERGSGNGLVGLRERAAAAGATVVTRPAQPKGFSLQVVVPA
ncbi:sensor histidine kinase [Nocardioides mangrovicus]|uniref:Sensor histidine kinase n=1 Tax=Nocardioides mangrovicus TaxID=2478913 RepID=A0A3L8P4W3_9ACTN|nr:sensor histidine kinase [Nocardioides mangrovicus]RLV49418.1 sensor histidine kinase [Nocardioides mangrovicus]